MKIDYDKPVLDVWDEPLKGGIKETPGHWTMGAACVLALNSFREQGDAYEKLETRGKLARRIVKGESLEASDIAEIRKCLAGTFTATVLYPVGEYLSRLVLAPPENGEAKKEE